MVAGKSRAGPRRSYFLSLRASMAALSKMEVRMVDACLRGDSSLFPRNWSLNGQSREDQSHSSEAFDDLWCTERTENGSLLTSPGIKKNQVPGGDFLE